MTEEVTYSQDEDGNITSLQVDMYITLTPKAPTQEYLDWLDNFLSAWNKLAVSIQDIQLDVAEQDYLNG